MFGSSMTETGTTSAQGSMSELIAAPSADREKGAPSEGEPVVNSTEHPQSLYVAATHPISHLVGSQCKLM